MLLVQSNQQMTGVIVMFEYSVAPVVKIVSFLFVNEIVRENLEVLD